MQLLSGLQNSTDQILTVQLFLLGGSGWCVNEIFQNKDGKFSNVDTTEYESIYAYQLLNIRPSVLKALMLPYDYIVVIDGDDIIELLNEKDESIITKNSP